MISSTNFFFFFKVVPYFVALVGLKLTVYPRLALVFQQSFSLCLLSIRITSLHHHTWAVKYFFKHDNSEEKTCDKPVRGGLVWHPWKHEVGGERSFVTQVFYEVPVTENCVPLRNIVSLHETQLKPWFVCVVCVCFPFLYNSGFLISSSWGSLLIIRKLGLAIVLHKFNPRIWETEAANLYEFEVHVVDNTDFNLSAELKTRLCIY